MYFDANSLYSNPLIMCYPLLVGNLKWVETSRKKIILNFFRERKHNFLVECDIEYLEEVRDLQSAPVHGVS